MSEKKYADDDPERTLVTLDQLSQTIEVMTSVVNRLRRHLSDQIKAQLESQIEAQEELAALAAANIETTEQIAQSASATEMDSPEEQLTVRRSEEHTSELQSHHDLVCRLLLEKKKTKKQTKKKKKTDTTCK